MENSCIRGRRTNHGDSALPEIPLPLNYMDRLRLQGAAKGKLFCGPSSIYVDLTTACNINCHFCWNHSPFLKKPVFLRDLQLPFPLVRSVIDTAVAWKSREILLSGDGEPTLHKNISDIISLVKNRKLKLFLATNGTFPEKLLPQIARADHVFIDFSSPDKDAYAQLQSPRNKNLFDRVVKNIRRLSALAKKRRTPRITVAFIITRLNYKLIPKMLGFLEELGIHDAAFRVVETTSATQPLTLRTEDKKQLMKILNASKRKTFPFRHNLQDVLDGLRHYEKSAFHFSKCYSGWFNISVDVNGRVGVCCHNERLTIGHLGSQSLKEIWESSKASSLRLLCRDKFHLSRMPFQKECDWCHWAEYNRKIEHILKP